MAEADSRCSPDERSDFIAWSPVPSLVRDCPA
jgi:hypothetical protein